MTMSVLKPMIKETLSLMGNVSVDIMEVGLPIALWLLEIVNMLSWLDS
jgi:hypothetical protein